VYALGEHFASLEMLHWSTSGQVVLMTVLGGLGTLWGGVLGAGVFLLLRDFLSTADVFRDAPGVVTGTAFILIVLGLRRGLWPTLGGLADRLRARVGRGALRT
jgi:branched-chain amino acid transport system permease protein